MNTAILEQINHIDWRAHTVHTALRTEAADGNGMDAMLHEIRMNAPDACTLQVRHDRLRLLQFLAQAPGGFRSLLQGEDVHVERKQLVPYVGWYSICWEGEAIEIALTPTTYIYGCAICIARSSAILLRFNSQLEEFGLRPAGRCLRYANKWQSAPEMDSEIGSITWDDIVIAPDMLASVRLCVEGFADNRDAFRALGFPWKRGLLFIGPPGTGKTMLCKAAAAALPDMPFLYVRDFEDDDDDCSNDDAIVAIFKRARKLAPCVLAFEDIDGLLTDTNRTAFLNELDGFENNDGLLIIASSNHAEKIDEALLKRPSRFDRVYHIGLPALPERREYCRRILEKWRSAGKQLVGVEAELLADRVAQATHGYSPAYLKEMFVSAGLERAQAGADVLDEQFAAALMAQISVIKRHMRKLKHGEGSSESVGDSCDLIGIRRR